MNHSDPVRLELVSLYKNSCYKPELYKRYYPIQNNQNHLQKWTEAIILESGGTKRQFIEIYEIFKARQLELQMRNSDSTANPYPYTVFLMCCYQVIENNSIRLAIERQLIIRAAALIEELMVIHLPL